MVKEENKLIGEYLFYLTFIIYLILLFIPQTELRIRLPESVQLAMKMARYACYALFAVRICTIDYYEEKHLLSVLIAAVCVAACVIAARNRQNIFVLLVAVAAYKSDGRKLVKCATFVFGIGLAATLLLCRLGVFENQVLSEGRARYNLGFNWVTLGPIYLMFICFGYAILRREKITLIEIAALEVFALYLFRMTNTRMAFLLNTAFLLIIAAEKTLLRNRWKLVRGLKYAWCLLPVAICLAVIIIQILYQPGIRFWDRLNDMLSNRLAQTEENFRTLPIRPFGQVVKWEGFSLGEEVLNLSENFESNNVDCSYLRILLRYGYVGLALVLFVYTCGIYKAVRANDPILVCVYAFVLVFSTMEQWLIELTFNPFVVVAAAGLTPIARKFDWLKGGYSMTITISGGASAPSHEAQ